MKSRWFQLLITIFIIFSYMQFEYVRYCMECDAGYQEYSYVNAVINIVGDRYLILLVSGILIVWSIAGLLTVTQNNFYLKLRIGSEPGANVIEVVYAFKYAVIIAVIQWVVINMIAVVNSFYNVQSQMLHVTKVYQLFGNLLLFYWLLGCVTVLFNKLINTGWAANICSIVCLLINIVISNRISFKDSFIGRKSWIAHLMVTDVKTYSFYIVYWSVSIAFVIMVIFYRAVILNFFKRLIAICVKSYYGLTFMAAVVIWSIYGFVSKQYMSGITDYFAGFKKLDIFLLLYLFYQMPIWILLYYFLTKNFSFYYIQFALRKGNTISWMKHLAIIFLVCTYLYYGVGMMVIAFISGTVINVNLIMEMSNMILQTIALLLLVFLCWLHEAGDKHMGFTIKYYIALMIFDVGFSLMMGIVFVYLRIRKIIAGYQTELEASQEQEKKARQEKDELMRNMAHDLRTPLTGVMAYVDVMKLENEAYAENMKNLNFISEKVLDIRTQVDNLLDFSIAGSQRPIELDASMDVEYIFGDYLSDVCAQLMKSNYEVDAEGISFKQVKVAVNMAFLTRIFSNLTDNIYKYADNKKPVVMKTAFTKKIFSVEIGNGVCDNKTLLKSAGIGLKSVDAMMQRMNGSMSFKRERGKFWVKLEFPIV